MAIEKYQEQLSGINYRTAINYYSRLKKKFFKELALNNSLMSEKEINQLQNNLIIQYQNGEVDNKQVQKRLNKIFNLYGESVFFDEKGQAQLNLNQINKEIDSIRADSSLEAEKKKEEINKILYQQVEQLGVGLKTQLAKAIGDNIQSDSKGEYKGILSRYKQLAKIYLSARLLNDKGERSIYGRPAATIGGLLKEDMVYEQLKKIFADTQIKLSRGGSVATYKGKETELDNILSFIDMNKEIFNQQMEVTTKINLPSEKVLFDKIKYYGEQIKTFSLNSQGNTGNILGKRISDNAALQKKLLSKNNPTIYDNIKFLHQKNNVLAAFGPETLIFSTGDKRYFTSEFITAFRDAKYYLMFGYSKPEYAITHTIVIDRPFVKNKKIYSGLI